MSIELDEYAQPVTNRFNRARRTTRDSHEFMGLAHGILADGSVNQMEAEYLLKWISQRPDAINTWPLNIFFERVSEMLSDGKLDIDEEKELIDTLMQLTGMDNEDETESGSTDLPLCTPEPPVAFNSHAFCLTGKFASGTRKECVDEILVRGGRFDKNPTLKTHYLVIGQLSSRDWINTSYGRKIEKAVKLRDENQTGINIISEQHWLAALEGMAGG